MADVLFACAALRELVCSGNAVKRAFRRASKAREVSCGIKDGRHLQQMSEAHCLGRRLKKLTPLLGVPSLHLGLVH